MTTITQIDNRHKFIAGMLAQQQGNASDFVFDNNNTIGLGLEIVESGFAEGLQAVMSNPTTYTTVAKVVGKVAGAGIIGLNVGLTAYTLYQEHRTGKLNTHSYVNGAVTGITTVATAVGIAIATGAIVVTSPVWGTALAVGGGCCWYWLRGRTGLWNRSVD